MGFSEIQEVVYRALLTDSSLDLDALAAVVGMRSEAVADVLTALVDLGVARVDAIAPAGVAMRLRQIVARSP